MDYQRRIFSNKQQYENDMKIYQEALNAKEKSNGRMV